MGGIRSWIEDGLHISTLPWFGAAESICFWSEEEFMSGKMQFLLTGLAKHESQINAVRPTNSIQTKNASGD